MQCPGCGHYNPDDALFCERCAADIVPVCQSCEKQNTIGAQFCRYCRTPLGLSEAITSSTGQTETSNDRQPPAPSSRTYASSTQGAPASFAKGRYLVRKVLGEGGKKKVYLAHDELLDRDVAFALIKTEGLDEVSRVRISREAQAMGRLGSHPHIVTVFDLGEVDSSESDLVGGATERQPFMVTELMGGGDVEGIVDSNALIVVIVDPAVGGSARTCANSVHTKVDRRRSFWNRTTEHL